MPKRDVQCLDPSEVDALATAAGRYGHLIKFLAYTGLRRSEAAALRHGDVQGTAVYVRRTQVDVNGHLSYGSPKSHAQRTIYLPTSFTLPTGSPESLVLTSPRGRALRCQNFARNAWKPATASVGGMNLRVHDLRQTAVSLLIQAGVHPR
jgi:integrase